MTRKYHREIIFHGRDGVVKMAENLAANAAGV